MTRTEKAQFIADLCGAVAHDITQKITSGKIPDEWTAHELRLFLAEKFAGEAAISAGAGGVLYPRGKRRREYQNTILINNL